MMYPHDFTCDMYLCSILKFTSGSRHNALFLTSPWYQVSTNKNIITSSRSMISLGSTQMFICKTLNMNLYDSYKICQVQGILLNNIGFVLKLHNVWLWVQTWID